MWTMHELLPGIIFIFIYDSELIMGYIYHMINSHWCYIVMYYFNF